ncbi:MAG: homoserine kinase, partial [Ktedonobacterales bacterium]|nr:homoserine kinase [Ktedonobacterales bacterium]
MALQHITVRVPASTANLGPAFDCLGLALDLHSTFTVARLPAGSASPQMTITSAWGDDPTLAALPTDERNLFYQVFAQHLTALGQAVPAVSINATLGVPSARGLGSSATAVIGGMLAAEAFAGMPDSAARRFALLDAAVAYEHGGHPDNVSA